MTRAMVGRKPKLSRETVQAIHVWAAFGRSISEVARNVGVSRSTLSRYLGKRHKREVA